ncbi:MAG: RlmE family RNA methyltransferase [SAR86 cluster bacterium]|jgi:23S rRNA (uridine2552-2'-O)-methyltransferase|uniref:Ribosomal RNA large subunit methyltransferase E n=1 Tax=SAR86 cluster bacterium TaxID=2030880 RepID=A0A520N1X6_9GAMM|nr:MAG: RlmE family RNA methyltransferase [Gammaproteobacteria bacterium TMED225]RZO27472.1 MAG: RlmE family RNA methyltransferase [SAR86 cluster bacterium]|tara:strand:- start:697 stop:1257 length:561 start_codon:yes stop_codon:yes gene_type:complete
MHADNWAHKAKLMGYRSRAVFKLEEILSKFKPNKITTILDLGSAPGGWSQFIIKKYPKSQVFAIDTLDMDSIKGIKFFKENIENINDIEDIVKLKGKFDLVISDIAPNLTGISAIDCENIFDLNNLTINAAINFLEANGSFIMKTFQNNNLKSLRKDMELSFNIVQTYKPAASKKKSGEIYLCGVK